MSWIHCHFPNHAEPPWTLRSIPGQGYAAFATRDFAAGELILVERPTVWVHGHHPFTATQVEEIERKISLLSDPDRQAFYAMANVYHPTDPECFGSSAAGIFLTNSFDMVDAPHGQSCAMYCAIGRLNHSCLPNVQQTHIPQTSEEVLHASRAIVKVCMHACLPACCDSLLVCLLACLYARMLACCHYRHHLVFIQSFVLFILLSLR